MSRYLASTALIAMIFIVAACATTDSSKGKASYTKATISKAKELFDRGALFIDVSDDLEYENGHIKGAINLDWNKTFSEEELSKIAGKNQEIVIYCYEQCYLSRQASAKAVSWGYEKVYQFYDGYPKWKSAGYPTEN